MNVEFIIGFLFVWMIVSSLIGFGLMGYLLMTNSKDHYQIKADAVIDRDHINTELTLLSRRMQQLEQRNA